MRAIKLLSKSKSRLAPKAPKIKGDINIRNHLKSALNIGTQKLKKKAVQLKPKNPFFLCPYFSKFTSIAIKKPPNYSSDCRNSR